MIPTFKDKKSLFKYLVENKEQLIRLKKSAQKQSDVIEIASSESTIKSKTHKADTSDSITRTLVLNTYGWMDSHDDVHIKGVFTKSIKENADKIMHLHDHVNQLTAQVGDPISVYEQTIKWSELGVDIAGETTSLMMDSEIKREYNALIFSKYEQGKISQHSVGMQYVNLLLCINDKEEKAEFANWNNYIDQVANREKAEDKGYFWAVTEAKLFEGSCVIRGSNELTPTLEPKSISFDDLGELPKLVEENPTKENISHLCNQFKALINQEPIELSLPNNDEPHKSNKSLFIKLIQS